MEIALIGISVLCLLLIIFFFAVHYGLFFLNSEKGTRRFFSWRNKWKKLIYTNKEDYEEKEDDLLNAA